PLRAACSTLMRCARLRAGIRDLVMEGRMVNEFVTLAEAKDYLRIDHEEEDAIIQGMIWAASDAVKDVASDIDWEETEPSFNVPWRLKLAVLTRVAVMYDNRQSVEAGKGELPMLTPVRKLET